MPIKVPTATGYKNVKDIKVSNGDGTYTNIKRVIQRQVDGTDKTIWQRNVQEYGLVFTGTQAIDTRVTNRNMMRVAADIVMTPVTANANNPRVVYAARQAGDNSSSHFFFYQDVGGVSRFHFGTSLPVPRETAPFGERLLIEQNRNEFFINGILFGASATTTLLNVTRLILGNAGWSTTTNTFVYTHWFIGIVYSFKVYVSDILQRDFVPVPQGSSMYSSLPAPSNCMWDKVTEEYFENAGTGQFGIIEE